MLIDSPVALAIYGLMLTTNVGIILWALLPANVGRAPDEPPTLRAGSPVLVRMVRRIHRRPTIASTLSR